MNKLTVTADLEDYCAGLTGSLQVNGFSGIGEGWFSHDDVDKFCSNANHLAESMTGSAELIGAQHSQDGSECLETFAIRCYVLSASKLNGVIGVHITISQHPGSNCREQEILKVSGELQIRNHKLGEFSGNLQKLVGGSLNEVILNGNLNDI